MKTCPSEDSLPSANIARMAIEYSVDGLLVIDTQGFVRFANPAAISLFSCMTDSLVGFQIGFPASAEPVELTLPLQDGNRYVEVRSVEIDWEGRTASLASLRDITERKRIGEALQAHVEDLQRQNNNLTRLLLASVDREINMIHLKEEVNQLCTLLGEAVRYQIPAEKLALLDAGKPG